jgi:hypothetical protein
MLEDKLGRSMTPEDLSKYLGINVKTVRQNYKKLGGIRLGSRYIFFEKGVYYAVSKEWKMDSPGEEVWEEKRKGICNKKGGDCVGKQITPIRKRVGRKDGHNLLD